MTTTTNLEMVHVESDDVLVGGTGSESLMGKFNDAINTLDENIGAVICTSVTRPSSPFPKMVIYETDTRLMYIRNAANTTWTLVNTGIPVFSSAPGSPFTNMIYYDSASGLLRRYTGSTWVMFYPNEQRVAKATSESVTSSATLQNDNDFSFPVSAGRYSVEGYIPFTGATDAASTGGLKCAFAGPAGATMVWTNFGENGVAGGGSLTDYNVVAQAMGGTRIMGTLTSGVATMSCQPKGTLLVGATAGTLDFQWAQGFSNATATTILAGAWMTVTKLT